MMDNLSIFIPMRKGSKRVLNKNSRQFTKEGKSLFEYKISQVIKILDLVNEIVISTDDQEIINQIPISLKENKKFKLVKRDKSLCNSQTKVKDLINHASLVTSGDAIFWIHITSPFVDENDYLKAIKYFREIIHNGTGDSIMSVNPLQQFIWDDDLKEIINVKKEINRWPNTQDLNPLYEINHAFYINTRESYLRNNDRIGINPKLYICKGIKKVDIDWNDEFEIAQNLIKLHEEKSD